MVLLVLPQGLGRVLVRTAAMTLNLLKHQLCGISKSNDSSVDELPTWLKGCIIAHGVLLCRLAGRSHGVARLVAAVLVQTEQVFNATANSSYSVPKL